MSDGRPTEAAAAAFEPGGVVRGVLARSRVLNPGGEVVLRLLIRLLWLVAAGGWGCPPGWRQSDQGDFGVICQVRGRCGRRQRWGQAPLSPLFALRRRRCRLLWAAFFRCAGSEGSRHNGYSDILLAKYPSKRLWLDKA